MSKFSLDEYYPGKGCTCAAYGESECACDADWTPKEVYELRIIKDAALEFVSNSYRPEPKYDAIRFDKLCDALGYKYE